MGDKLYWLAVIDLVVDFSSAACAHCATVLVTVCSLSPWGATAGGSCLKKTTIMVVFQAYKKTYSWFLRFRDAGYCRVIYFWKGSNLLSDCVFSRILSQILKHPTSLEWNVRQWSPMKVYLPCFSLWKIQLHFNLRLAQSMQSSTTATGTVGNFSALHHFKITSSLSSASCSLLFRIHTDCIL